MKSQRSNHPAWIPRQSRRSSAIATICCALALALSPSAQVAVVDETFNPGIPTPSTLIGVQPGNDGTTFILGAFIRVDGRLRSGLAQLDSTGRITGFQISSTRDLTLVRGGDIWGMAKSKNDTWLLWGGFLVDSATTRFAGLTRLSGSNLDSEFQHIQLDGSQPDGSGVVLTAVQQNDDRILVGGAFSHLNKRAQNNLARLHANGTPDADFNARLGSGPNDMVNPIVIQKDGRILIAGNFTSFNGTPRARIARLNRDGSLDLGFNAGGVGPDGTVTVLKVQDDGKIVIGGVFRKVNGTTCNGVARLTATGQIDDTFQPGLGGKSTFVRAIELLPNGDLLLGGIFDTVHGVRRGGLARVDYFGSLVPEFFSNSEDLIVNALALDAEGRILLGGTFTRINGVNRTGIARLQVTQPSQPAVGSLRTPSPLEGNRMGLMLASEPGVRYSIQSSADCVVWQEVTNFVATSKNSCLVLPGNATSGRQFYRSVAR